MSDADEGKQISKVADLLVMRVCAAIPPDDAELNDLGEQWVGAFGIALKYAQDNQAAHVANTLLEQLVAALKARGITTI